MNAKATKLQSPHDVLWTLIHDIRFAMMTTRHPHGLMRSRPVTAQNRSLDASGRLWFFVPLGSELADELTAEPQVNLVYAAPDRGRYVSVAGDAGFVFDEARRERLCPLLAKPWLPCGADASGLGLLEVRIEQAESWDADSARMQPVFRAALRDGATDSGSDVAALGRLQDAGRQAPERSTLGDTGYLQ